MTTGEQVASGVSAHYEAPELILIGSLTELTLGDKRLGESDGFTFMGAPITNASA